MLCLMNIMLHGYMFDIAIIAISVVSMLAANMLLPPMSVSSHKLLNFKRQRISRNWTVLVGTGGIIIKALTNDLLKSA